MSGYNTDGGDIVKSPGTVTSKTNASLTHSQCYNNRCRYSHGKWFTDISSQMQSRQYTGVWFTVGFKAKKSKEKRLGQRPILYIKVASGGKDDTHNKGLVNASVRLIYRHLMKSGRSVGKLMLVSVGTG